MNTTDILDYYNAYLSRMLPGDRRRASWALQQLAEFMPQSSLNTKGTRHPAPPPPGKRP
ncbi:MAG: hypothetical protein ACRCU9_07225 [Iodobacter sp.]